MSDKERDYGEQIFIQQDYLETKTFQAFEEMLKENKMINRWIYEEVEQLVRLVLFYATINHDQLFINDTFF